MKKMLSVLLTISVMLSALLGLAVNISAEEAVAAPTTTGTETTKLTLPSGTDSVMVTPETSTKNMNGFTSKEVEWNEVWDTDTDSQNLTMAETNSSADNFASAKLINGGTDGLYIETVGTLERPTTISGMIMNTYGDWIKGFSIGLSADGVNYDTVVAIPANFSHSNSNYYIYFEVPEAYRSNTYRYVKLSNNGVANTVYQLYYCMLLTSVEVGGADPALPAGNYRVSVKPTYTTENDSTWHDVKRTWETVWDTSTKEYSSANLPQAALIETRGAFAKPTTISGVIFKIYNADRVRGFKLSLSKDGENWDTVAMISNDFTVTGTNLCIRYMVPEAYANTEYSYARLTNDHGAGVVQIYYCMLLTSEGTLSNQLTVPTGNYPVGVEATYTTTNYCAANNATRQWSNIWKYDNATFTAGNLTAFTDEATGESYDTYLETRGKLANATTVSGIAIKLQSRDRVGGLEVSLSADGEKWDTVVLVPVQMGTTNVTQYLYYDIPEAYAGNQYSYVKLNSTRDSGWHQLYSCMLFSNEMTPNYAGTQSKMYTHETLGEVYAVRFVGTLAESVLTNCTKVGFEITATYEGGVKDCSRETKMVYTAVYANNKLVYPQDLEGGENHAYIFALTVADISVEKYEEIEFTVRPYMVTSEGETVYADTYTVVYCDGECVR